MELCETASYLPVRAGQSLHVQQAGPVRAPTWIFLHGYGDGAYIWQEAMRALMVSHSMLAVDLPGHGSSYRVASGDYSTAAAVEDLAQLMAGLRSTRVALIGHSWGGLIAMHLAAAFPTQVAALAVVDSNPERNEEAVEHVTRHLKASLRTYDSAGELARWLQTRLPLASASTVWTIARGATRLRADGLLELKLDPVLADRVPREEEVWEILPRISVPAMFIRGEFSGIVSAATARKVVNKLSRGQLRTVSRAGHAVMIDNPAGFLSVLTPFIKQVEQRENAEAESSSDTRGPTC